MTKLIWVHIVALILCSLNLAAQDSKVWQDFKVAKENGHDHILPDFSYAGYKYSEVALPKVDFKVFNVIDYGAVPNDDRSDKESIKKAIAAASKNGEGVIFFPKGKYFINTEEDSLDIVKIESSKIVFRGEGANENGSILLFKRDLPPANPEKLWTVPYAIKTTVEKKGKFLTNVISDARRETFVLKVEDASRIKPGDWVVLKMKNNDKELVAEDIAPLSIEPKWTTIQEKGVQINEMHKVASVHKDTLVFSEPIHYNVNSSHGWKLYHFPHLQRIGFENIMFLGNWDGKFVHHRSPQDDGGWSILNLNNLVNSWVRNCTFKNVNRALSINSSAAVTALNISVEGKIGHNGVSAGGGSTGILLAYINDKAGMHHTTGVGGGSTTGTVIWRSTHPSHTSFESHASQPRCTLFDNVKGGFFAGRAGGAIKNLPNHGRFLVLWNYEETDEPEKNFDFISKTSEYWKIVPPIVVGFYGKGSTFNKDEVQLQESIGKPVQPESLFEEQLKLRLGKLPDWIVEQKRNQNSTNNSFK
ncbi:DUF4955 domain-containing protein [Aquimarina aggregata]|uniref:DUF4955 domain-containing protein n=1 Tax=Aquimarina aggregata TaxID=1642818 RepID=UPI00248FD57B|nr:DUF4955 domain-containing protein [Aquimarina aggregata]